MLFYNINDNGELSKIDNIDFEENAVYLIDDTDTSTVYIWVGYKVPFVMRKKIDEISTELEKERGSLAKVLIVEQDKEYGSFLAMMEDFKKGMKPGVTTERRPELKLEEPSGIDKNVNAEKAPEEKGEETETDLKNWLSQLSQYRKLEPEKAKIEPEDIDVPDWIEEPEEETMEMQVEEAAYFLSLKNYTYDELCWFLGEKIQKINMRMPSLRDIMEKAEEVFNSSSTYDELCWLNAEMDVLVKKNYLKAEGKIYY